ncbi:nSTAND1 domain-containing NTPase [Pedococcus sp. 5OH_020]|uniref:nSTAND1 domain-containing NTPase n=1 Tax=Pedococcus sp. 5OH_020 TaxID=2989814 RepID=UPI0022E9DC3F|nr:BTAD domain-containing putative transcriptional regulator [Pedococcus sp. 5OH_020]
MEIAVLGPVEVNGGSTALSRRDRVVLAALVARRGEAVGNEALAEALWGDNVPDTWQKVVQGCIVRLRKLVGTTSIETLPHGYRLRAHTDAVDSHRFERLLTTARERLRDGEPDRARYLVAQALALWRGKALAELEEWPPGRSEAQRLEELRLEAEDLHTEAALRAGNHRDVLAVASSRLSEEPLRERRWALVALAQYQGGRQHDALVTLRRATAMLARELGLDPSPELVDLEAAILRQDPQLSASAPPAQPSSVCPYRGLLPYGVEDAATFFGRSGDVSSCLDRLDSAGVLAVVGPSGCGKSSLVRAGIAAALRRDGRPVLVVTPGSRPLETLPPAASPRAVLVVDQCEEALGEDVDAQERTRWIDELVRHSERSQLVLALRADRVGALAAYPTLARLVERGLYLLGGMQEPNLRDAVEGPALQSGLRLDPGLLDLLVREVQGEPGALPLLSHALRQTWLRREGATLTVAGYRASGGVREALNQSADGLYDRLDPGQREVLRDLMLRLVSPAADGEPMGARVPRRHIVADPARAHLVEQLVAARLVSSDDQSVEIAHEALAREWPRLRSWLDEDVEGQRILRHLSLASDSWDTMGRPDSELYRGVRLAQALEWRAPGRTLSPVERAFLDASQAAAASEREAAELQVQRERRTNSRLRSLLAVAAALALVAAVTGVLALGAADRAGAQAVTADARRVGAEALTAPRADTSLLLAVAGMRLDHGSDSAKANLAAALDRAPLLKRSATTPPAGAIAVDPRSGNVALSLAGGGVNVYEPRSLKLLAHTSTGGGGHVIAYSPDGVLLAAADFPDDPGVVKVPHPLHLFDAKAQPLASNVGGVPENKRNYYSLVFSGDGSRLGAVLNGRGSDGSFTSVGVWDLDRLDKPVAMLYPDSQHITTGALSRDGHTLFTNGDYFLRSIDVATGGVKATRTGPQIGLQGLAYHDQAWTPQLAVSPDGKTLAVVAESEIGLLDTATLKLKARLEAHGRVQRITFSADGRRFAAADGGVVVWDVSAATPRQVFRGETWGGNLVALSPDGTSVYAAGLNAELLAWDLGGSSGFVTSHPGPPLKNTEIMAQVSPDGRKMAYLANLYARMDVRDVATGRLIPTIDPNGTNLWGQDLTWRPDTKAVVGVTGDDVVEARDATTGRHLITAYYSSEHITTAQYTADGRLLAGNDRGLLHVMRATTLRQDRPAIQALDEQIDRLSVNPADHTVLVEGSTERAIIDYVSGRRLRTLPYAGFFSPDGRTTAVVDDDGAVGFLKDHENSWVARPDPSHAFGDRTSAAFSHNGAWFASSRKGQVGLWSAPSGSFLGSVPVAGEVAVGFSSDDSTVVIAGLDGSVQSWNVRPQAWVATACAIAGRQLTSAEWASALPGRPYERVCPGSAR